MRINHVIPSIYAAGYYQRHVWELEKSIQRMSSGQILPQDDPGVMGASSRIRVRWMSLDQAVKNGQQASTFLGVADGALQSATDILGQMKQQAIEYGTDGLYGTKAAVPTGDYAAIASTYLALRGALVQIFGVSTTANTGTVYNGKSLFNNVGTGGDVGYQGQFDFRIGADNAGGSVRVTTFSGALQFAGLPLMTSALTTQASVDGVINGITYALNLVGTRRAAVGAIQRRVEQGINIASIESENQQAAESRMVDVDMAKEMVRTSKLKILQQSSLAMIAQGNVSAQAVLSLLGT